MRELKEETGLTGQSWQLIGNSNHSYPDRTLVFDLFTCQVTAPSILVNENEYVWVNPSYLAQYPMPEANVAVLALLSNIGIRQL